MHASRYEVRYPNPLRTRHALDTILPRPPFMLADDSQATEQRGEERGVMTILMIALVVAALAAAYVVQPGPGSDR